MSTAHHDAHADGVPHATFKGYMIGFGLSVFLTLVPFWLVMGKVIANPGLTVFYIVAFGAIQMLVHVFFFLHMNTKAEGGWLAMSFSFTVLLLVICLVGSVWIMYHLNTNMMPLTHEAARQLP